jgi:hypothetical protein
LLVVDAFMPERPKHHYIPVFYLKQWAGSDRKLCEYSQPYKTVIARRKFPTETGFERGLYTLTAHSPAIAEIVEDKLMRQTDQYAALAHQQLLQRNLLDMDMTLRSGWARFILSLIRRAPETLKALEERVSNALVEEFPHLLTLPGDPSEEDRRLAYDALLERQRTMILQSTITSERIGTHLINMRWSVVTFGNARHLLLTSDRPYIMTNGVGHHHSHIAIPVSPTQCFLAANSQDIENQIHGMRPEEFMKITNDKMASQARKYVYGVDDSQLRFVSNRFGRRIPAAPGENL